jgi:hypothetical protein
MSLLKTKFATKPRSNTSRVKKIKTKKPASKIQAKASPKSLKTGGRALALPVLDERGHRHALLNVSSFSQVMEVGPLLKEVSNKHGANLLESLRPHGGDLLVAGFTGAAMIIEAGTYTVRFSEKGAKLLKAKELKLMTDKAGGQLAVLVDGSNRTREQARLLTRLAKSPRFIANIGTLVVSAAHIISGQDLAKKLDKLSEKVDFLIEGRRIDQIAKIEGVYRQAKEILLLTQNQRDIHRLGRDLFEVRSAWRQEMLFHLKSAPKAKESASWIMQSFTRLFRPGKDQKVASSVSRTELEIHMINGCFALHLALAQASGTMQPFLSVSLREELEEMRILQKAIEEREDWIHKKNPALKNEIRSTLLKLSKVNAMYSEMVAPDLAEPLLLHGAKAQST